MLQIALATSIITKKNKHTCIKRRSRRASSKPFPLLRRIIYNHIVTRHGIGNQHISKRRVFHKFSHTQSRCYYPCEDLVPVKCVPKLQLNSNLTLKTKNKSLKQPFKLPDPINVVKRGHAHTTERQKKKEKHTRCLKGSKAHY